MRKNNIEKIINDPMLFELYNIESIDGNIIECSLKKEYGNGKVVFIEIEDGVFVQYSDYCFNHVDNCDLKFDNDIITMYKIIEGSLVMNINDKKSIILKKGDIFNFAGNNKFFNFDGDYQNIISISIFGYCDCIQKFLEDFFKDDLIISNYYCNIKKMDNGLIYKNDIEFENLFFELLKSFKTKNINMIKLKSLQVIYYGMIHCDEGIDTKMKNYDQYYVRRVDEVKQYLDQNWNQKISLKEMADKFNINSTYLKEIFKMCFDISPHKYLIKIRLDKSQKLLQNKEIKISEIASSIGFSSASRYSESFKNHFGYLPSQYRKKFNSNK